MLKPAFICTFLLIYFGFLIMVNSNIGVLTQMRWCFVNHSSPSQWIVYDDSVSSCVHCGETIQLFENRSLPGNEKCCNGQFSSNCASCTSLEIGCENGNSYCQEKTCDGYNDCGDGTDEIKIGSTPCGECINGQYRCSGNYGQCFTKNEVCNGVKDCFTGSDEVNCLYYGGRCSGFLCSVFPQCIPAGNVCNGKKDCLDGTDEFHCLPKCDENFHCNTSQEQEQCPSAVINLSKVCDGTDDCNGGIDENNCHTWMEWSLWSSCNCPLAIESSHLGYYERNRVCATFHDQNRHSEGKCVGEVREIKNCTCFTTTDVMFTTASQPLQGITQTILAIIILAGLIVVVAVVGLCYIMWSRHQKSKNNKINNTSQMTHERDSFVSGVSGVTAGSLLHTSPSQFYNRSAYKNPLLSITAAPENSGRDFSMANNTLQHTSSTEDLYERIMEQKPKVIDPYAETRSQGLAPASSTLSLLPASSVTTPYRRRSSSFSSLNGLVFEKDGFSVRKCSNSPHSHHDKPIAFHKSISFDRFSRSSTDTIDKDGYMLPIGQSGSTYASMTAASPNRKTLHDNKQLFKGTVDTKVKLRNERYLRSTHMRTHHGQRQLKQSHLNNTRPKSLYHQKDFSKYRSSEDISYHSDTYATMKGRVYCQNGEESDSEGTYSTDILKGLASSPAKHTISNTPSTGDKLSSSSQPSSQATTSQNGVNDQPPKRYTKHNYSENKPAVKYTSVTLKIDKRRQDLEECKSACPNSDQAAETTNDWTSDNLNPEKDYDTLVRDEVILKDRIRQLSSSESDSDEKKYLE